MRAVEVPKHRSTRVKANRSGLEGRRLLEIMEVKEIVKEIVRKSQSQGDAKARKTNGCVKL